MSDRSDNEKKPSDGENYNVAEEPGQQPENQQQVENSSLVREVPQQPQPIVHPPIASSQPMIVVEHNQGTMFYYRPNEPPQQFQGRSIPNPQNSGPPVQNLPFPPQQYVTNPQYNGPPSVFLPCPPPQNAPLMVGFNPQQGVPMELNVAWPGQEFTGQYIRPEHNFDQPQRSQRFRPYSRGSFRGRARHQHSTRGYARNQQSTRGNATGNVARRADEPAPDMIFNIIPTGSIVINGLVTIEKACFHQAIPENGQSSSIVITNPIRMVSLPDDPGNRVMSNPTVLNSPITIKDAHFYDELPAQGHIYLGELSASNQQSAPPTTDAPRTTTGSSSNVQDASSQTDTAQENNQEQNDQDSIEDCVQDAQVENVPAQDVDMEDVQVQNVEDKDGPVQDGRVEHVPVQDKMTFAEKVASNLNNPVNASAAKQPTQLETVKSKDHSTSKVKKVASSAIQKAEKPSTTKRPKQFNCEPIASHWQQVEAQGWTKVGGPSTSNGECSSSSDVPITIDDFWVDFPTFEQRLGHDFDIYAQQISSQGPSSSTAPVNDDWLDYLTTPHELGSDSKTDDDGILPESKETVEESERKTGDEKVRGVKSLPILSAAQKKAQKDAELDEFLVGYQVKNQLTKTCKAYIDAHHNIRQTLLKNRVVTTELVDTDDYQRWLLEFSIKKPETYWNEEHETAAKLCLKQLKNICVQGNAKDEDLRMKCEVLLENMHMVFAQDLLCIHFHRKENVATEIEKKYFPAVFNFADPPKLFHFSEKLNSEMRQFLDTPKFSIQNVTGLLNEYVKRQMVIRKIGNQGTIQYKSPTEESWNIDYLNNKEAFERFLESNRNKLITQYLNFWRHQQKVLLDNLPEYQDRTVAVSLLLIDLLITCPLEDPNNDVLLFDAVLLYKKEYRTIKDSSEIIANSWPYLAMVLGVEVVKRQEPAE